jgi:hypothetical protein
VAAEPEGKTVSSRSVKILAVVVLLLFGTLFALNSGDRGESSKGGEGSDLLFPELKSRLNDINVVTITDADGEITLRREADDDDSPPAGRWIAPDYGGYPVDTGSLRRLLLAIADARKLEQKTSDAGLYERLGVQDPRENDGSGVLVSARGDNAAIALILGDTAQAEFRYARIPEEARSWLISQNPTLPADRTGWLLPEIVDIDASRIESAIIRHADGEVVAIRKTNADDLNFEVENIPEGRELRYPSVADSIGAVLGNLTLEDVRPADSLNGPEDGSPEDAASTVEFRTFDGLEVMLNIHSRSPGKPDGELADSDTDTDTDTEQYWITLKATASPAPADDEPQEPAEDPASADAETAAEQAKDPADEAADINNRVSGWMYGIAAYKADQLTRRLDDLLSDAENAATD